MSDAEEIRQRFARVHEANTQDNKLRALSANGKLVDAIKLASEMGRPVQRVTVGHFDRARGRP